MDNLWTRRTNTSKLSLTTPNTVPNGSDVFSPNASVRRGGGNTPSHAKSNPFNNTPVGGVSSPTTGASSAFGLGSGAFASFGSAKTPKSTGNPFDTAMASAVSKSNQAKDGQKPVARVASMASISEANRGSGVPSDLYAHPLNEAWSFWYRPPISKAHGYIEYEHTLHGIATISTGEEFWDVYTHLKRPSTLPVVSDYHLFKKDIRPIWEDDINRRGGKWIVRMKKGVADRYWEDLLLALIGDQFGESGEEVCGAVLSVRNGEDILSIWTKTDDGRVLKIRETMKKVLNFPPNTRIDFKSHDSSIQQRTAIDEQRREKANQHHHEKRQGAGGARQQQQQQSHQE